MTDLRDHQRFQSGALPLPPDDLKPSRLVTVSDPPAAVLQDGADPQKDAPSARAGLAIPRPPWVAALGPVRTTKGVV